MHDDFTLYVDQVSLSLPSSKFSVVCNSKIQQCLLDSKAVVALRVPRLVSQGTMLHACIAHELKYY